MNDELLSPAELADVLGISVHTLYNWRVRGEGPPGFRVGGRVRYRRSAVEAWLHLLNGHAEHGGEGLPDAWRS